MMTDHEAGLDPEPGMAITFNAYMHSDLCLSRRSQDLKVPQPLSIAAEVTPLSWCGSGKGSKEPFHWWSWETSRAHAVLWHGCILSLAIPRARRVPEDVRVH